MKWRSCPNDSALANSTGALELNTSTGKLRFNLRWWGSSDHTWGDRRGKPDEPILYSLKASPANTAALQSRGYSHKKSKTRAPGMVPCIDKKKKPFPKPHYANFTYLHNIHSLLQMFCIAEISQRSAHFRKAGGTNALGRRLTSGFGTWNFGGMNHQSAPEVLSFGVSVTRTHREII